MLDCLSPAANNLWALRRKASQACPCFAGGVVAGISPILREAHEPCDSQNPDFARRLKIAICERAILTRKLPRKASLFVELLWFGIVLAFYETVFTKTSAIATWQRSEYLFFVGCYFSLLALIEALFLSNCSEFAELIRTGDLDFFLLQPIDEQFLITCRTIDWSCVANVAMGFCVMGIGLYQMGWAFSLGRATAFLALFLCGVAIAYSLLVFLTSISV